MVILVEKIERMNDSEDLNYTNLHLTFPLDLLALYLGTIPWN